MIGPALDATLAALVPAAIGALSGGAVAAAITARSTTRLERTRRRDTASSTLWDYQRALTGYATKLYEKSGVGDETFSLPTAELDEVRSTLRTAYPWATYLSKEAQTTFFRYPYIEIGQPPYDSWGDTTSADSAEKLASGLAVELEIVFPLQRRTPAQSWRRWRHKRAGIREIRRDARALAKAQKQGAAGVSLEPALDVENLK